jgi:nicotinamide riboside kinase|tara:strand:- start:422 stop:943 length:522 start_codon:yes stop_codon:yes gene_type:complete
MSTEILVITGPESSGKTTLAAQLADYWKTPIVAEASRDYLKGQDSYQQRDLLEIAKQQHKQEQTVLSLLPERIICDTDLLVIMIWSEVKYGHCDPWICNTFENSIKKKNSCRHYYLCDSNIPWQADPLRENPHNRDELFDLYLQKLKEYELDYRIVKGEPQERLQLVLDSSFS